MLKLIGRLLVVALALAVGVVAGMGLAREQCDPELTADLNMSLAMPDWLPGALTPELESREWSPDGLRSRLRKVDGWERVVVISPRVSWGDLGKAGVDPFALRLKLLTLASGAGEWQLVALDAGGVLRARLHVDMESDTPDAVLLTR